MAQDNDHPKVTFAKRNVYVHEQAVGQAEIKLKQAKDSLATAKKDLKAAEKKFSKPPANQSNVKQPKKKKEAEKKT